MAEDIPRVLVVEDNWLIAMEVASLVEQHGCRVVGPFGSVTEAMSAVGQQELKGAVLDINLGDEWVWPVADLLLERGVPVVLASGYGHTEVPERFERCPLCTKPTTFDSLGKALEEVGAIRT